MKEFILQLFTDIASIAMDKNQSVTLRYDVDQGESKTIISSSKRDENTLTLSIYPVSEPEEPDEASEDPSEDEENEEEEE